MVAVERPRRAHGGCWGSCGDGDRSRTDPAGPGALSPLPRGLLPVRSVGSGSALTQKVVGAEGNLEARQPPPSPPPPPGPGVCCAPGVALPVLGTAPGRAVLRVPSASPSGAARGAMCGGVELRHALLAVGGARRRGGTALPLRWDGSRLCHTAVLPAGHGGATRVPSPGICLLRLPRGVRCQNRGFEKPTEMCDKEGGAVGVSQGCAGGPRDAAWEQCMERALLRA